MREEWKDKMKQTLEGFQMEAPDGLWDDINRRMASELAMGNATVKRQNRMRIIAIRSLAAAACAAGLAGIFFTLNDGGNEGRRIARSVAQPHRLYLLPRRRTMAQRHQRKTVRRNPHQQ